MRPGRRRWCLLGLLLPVLAGCQGGDYQQQLQKGLEMVYEGDYQDAEVYFIAMARQLATGDDPQTRTWRAQALREAGRVEHLYLGEPRRAVARLREAMKLGVEDELAFKIQLEIADIFYNRLHDYRNAALEFERLVNLFDGERDTGIYRYRIAQCYFTLRQFEQARAEARLLVEKHGNSSLAAEGMLLIANSYYVEGEYRQAVQAHRRLQSMNPGESLASRSLFELGLCYQQLGELHEAEESFLGALRYHPRPDIVQRALAQVRKQMAEEGYSTPEEPEPETRKKRKPLPQPKPKEKTKNRSEAARSAVAAKPARRKDAPKKEERSSRQPPPPAAKKTAAPADKPPAVPAPAPAEKSEEGDSGRKSAPAEPAHDPEEK